MTHFQFTSPNAAGAKDNQAMLTAMREALKEVQAVEAEVISAAPMIAEVQGDAIQSQAEHEASQMRAQAIGSIVGGGVGILSAGADLFNERAGASSDALLEEAQYNDDYADALEDGKSIEDTNTIQAEAEESDTTDLPRTDQEETAQARQTREQRSEEAKERVRNKFESDAQKGELKNGARNRQTEAESHEDAVKRDKAELRRESSEMNAEDRSDMVKRFRRRADNLRSQAHKVDSQIQRKSQRYQTYGQIGNSISQASGSFMSAYEKEQAGTDQRQAEMSRLLAQGRQKTEDNSSGQAKSVADSLKGAVDAQRNYYASRG